MIRYYPDIIVQKKHMEKLENKLGYTHKNGHAIASTKKPSKAKIQDEMLNERWKLMATHYSKSHTMEQTAKKFHMSMKDLKKAVDFYTSTKRPTANPYGDRIMFGPGFMPRTIGGTDKGRDHLIKEMYRRYNRYAQELPDAKHAYHQKLSYKNKHKILGVLAVPSQKRALAKVNSIYKRQQFYLGMFQHGLSLNDMTSWTYHMREHNPNTISYWYPLLMQGYDKSNHFFKVPKTKIWTLPIEIAQYLQTDYQQTNQVSRDAFNKLVFDAFDLDKNKSYFIKTGVFSGKYEFRNAHCKEPLEMGEYFHVINNFAMTVGAATSIDLCVREWIPDVEHRPTIYHGMPLRTEFRSFIDFDKNKVLGIVPYWNPLVMDRVLQRQGKHNPAIQKDYQTYRKNIPSMMKEFNASVPKLQEQLQKLIPKVPMHGKWSLDVMKNGSQYYLIDMSLMKNSALTELLPKYHV